MIYQHKKLNEQSLCLRRTMEVALSQIQDYYLTSLFSSTVEKCMNKTNKGK